MTKYNINIRTYDDLSRSAKAFVDETYPSRNDNWLFYQTGKRIIIKRGDDGSPLTALIGAPEIVEREVRVEVPAAHVDFSGQLATIATAVGDNIAAKADVQELAGYLNITGYEEIL